jgi:hypothetical protein
MPIGLTNGLTEITGIFTVSEDFDSVGDMVKLLLDLALLIELVLTTEARAKLPADCCLPFLKNCFAGLYVVP